MKKITLLLALGFFIASASFAQTTTGCSEIFISEYLDGINNNKAIEIFNPINAAKSLNGYSILIFPLGSLVPINIPLQGSISAKGSFVLANPLASSAVLSKANQTDVNMLFSGRNAVVLQKQNINIDKIGEIGVLPNLLGWSVPPNGSTSNHDLRRKYAVTAGDTVWNNCKNEWDIFPNDSIYNLGSHSSVCDTVALPPVIVQQPDSVYWYVNGRKNWYHVQKDVYVFRAVNGQQYNSPTDLTVVQQKEFNSPITARQLNELRFIVATTESAREIERNKVRNNPIFECQFTAITKEPTLDRTFKKWKTTDDITLVTFRDPNITSSQVQIFANKYDLILTHSPSLQLAIGNHSYFFRLSAGSCNTRTSISTAAKIWEQDSSIVLIAEPNINDVVQLFSSDPYYSGQWQIKNTSQCVGLNPAGSVLASANCRIEDVWNLGYKGGGIKVAVMDLDGFETNHPDLNTQFINGWNCVNDNAIITPDYIGTDAAHGQACAGLIAAKANNATGTVGVAYDAQVVPYKIGGTSTTAYVLAFQKAQVDADIVSASFGWNDQFYPSIDNAITNCRNQGRGGLGCLIFFACGNFDGGGYIPAQTDNIWPANSSSVIGVIATNPSDKLKTSSTYGTILTNDGWGNFWGSNYGKLYDIAAPGTHVISTDYQAGNGFNTGASSFYSHNNCDNTLLNSDYTYFLGTSAAAPITAGVAALILSSNPSLTAAQVEQLIYDGADKVGGYDYNAVSTGKSYELGYGRINAYRSILLTPVGIEENQKNFGIIRTVNPVSENLEIIYKLNNVTQQTIQAHVRDMFGRDILMFSLNSQATYFSTNISTLPSGLYFITFTNEQGNIIQTDKVMIIR